MNGLRSALSSIPDHRQRRGREYKLESLLCLVVAGFMSGCNSLAGVARFAKRLTREQRESLGFLWFKVPAHSTLCVAFHGVDVEALEAALSRVVLAGHKEGVPLHLAIDGKTLRGSATQVLPKAAQMLACFSDALAGVVSQTPTKGGYDEVTAAIALLEQLPLKECVVTGDAMFTDRHLCDTIGRGGGNYVLPIKDNRPSLRKGALRALEKKHPADA